MSFAYDMSQDDQIKILTTKVARLERKLSAVENKENGGNNMSKIIKDLIGFDCIITSDELIFENKCRIVDADEDWVRVLVYNKKGDKTIIVPIYSIRKIELPNEKF